MRNKIKPVQVYAGWGAFFGVLANLLQMPLDNYAHSAGYLLGGALAGTFVGSMVWWLRSRIV